MEFLLDLLFTAFLALLISFLVAKLVSVVTAGVGEGKCPNSNYMENPDVGDCLVMGEARFGMKMDAKVLESESSFRVFDENIELVDRFENEVDHRVDEIATGDAKVTAERRNLVVLAAEAESSDNVIAEEIIVRGQEEKRDSAEEICAEREEMMIQTMEVETTGFISPENVAAAEEIMLQEQDKRNESTDPEPKEEETNTVEKEELSIEEEDDDWEGIERSELEKAFAAAAKLLEESGKAEEIGAEAKMELYSLHKIATEGPCREAQPMAIMLSARAKWNAWKSVGNMGQEEAMEQYLSLISKEIPGLMNTDREAAKK